MKNKAIIEQEAKEIFIAINKMITGEKSQFDFVLTWWLNPKNYELKSKLPTSKINSRCNFLVKKGLLKKDENITSKGSGSCYRLTGCEW